MVWRLQYSEECPIQIAVIIHSTFIYPFNCFTKLISESGGAGKKHRWLKTNKLAGERVTG